MEFPYESSMAKKMFESLPKEVQQKYLEAYRLMNHPEDLNEALKGMRLKRLQDDTWPAVQKAILEDIKAETEHNL